MQTRWCKHPQDAPQCPVPPPLPGDRGAEPHEQRVTASCPAPYPLPAAAGPTGHTGSPPNGSPSATAAHRPECAGLAQGLPGCLPAPHRFRPPLNLPQLCTRPAPTRLSLLAHPPRVCSQTPTLLLTLARGRHPATPPTHRSAAHPPPCCKQSASRGLSPPPSGHRSRTLCPLVWLPRSGFPIKSLQVLALARATGTWTQVLRPRPTRGSLSSGAGRPRVACRRSPQLLPRCPHQEPACFWVASVHAVEATGLGWGGLVRDLNLEFFLKKTLIAQ